MKVASEAPHGLGSDLFGGTESAALKGRGSIHTLASLMERGQVNLDVEISARFSAP